MAERFAGFDVGLPDDEEILRRALELAQRRLPEYTRRGSGASEEELKTFPFGDELIRSPVGKLPVARETIAAARILGALGKGAVEGGTQALTATGRAARGEIAPENMQEEALNTAMTIGGAGLGLAGNVSRMTPNQLQMFFGPKAATADLKALDRAKRMSLLGATETDIRNATGWMQGVDGNWRFEVPDDGLKVKTTQSGGIIEHPEIEAAYPGLLDSFSIRHDTVNANRPGNQGYWDPVKREMGIFVPEAERRSVAAHELQHIISHHEGNAPGMSPQDPQIYPRIMRPEVEEAKTKARELVGTLDAQHFAPRFNAYREKSTDPDLPEWEYLDDREKDYFRKKFWREGGIPAEVKDQFKTARDIILDEDASPFSAYGQYRREAGEVEARNVQARLNMTPEERRRVLPRVTEDIPREEQWVAKRAPEYAWSELPDGDAVSRALTVAASRPVESLVYRAGDELSPEGSGYQAVPGKPSVVTIPGYGKVEARPVQPLQDAAETYMRSVGRPGQHDVTAFPRLDEDRAARIAEAYARMRHDPTDPRVAKAYDAMAEETMAQYRALRDQGLDFHFLRDGEPDPYARSPSLGYPDIIKNGRLTVFPTEQGFGSNELFDPSANPLLKKVGKVGDLEDATVNDAFRAVHDAYGHFGPGNPFFRAPGEERAWFAHSRMYSPEAVPAMTSETRGQNSWLNFGPHREHNKTALGADTIFADQKTGLMDDWTWALDPNALYPTRADGGRLPSGPHLRPAVKIGGKVYAADLGGTHMDALSKAKADLSPTEYGRAARDDSTRGYVTHKGGFLDRFKAFNFAQKNGLIDPKYQNWFGEYFTNGRPYELPSEVLMGYSDERSAGGGLPAYLVPHRAAGGRVTPADDALAVLRQPTRVFDDHPARIPQRFIKSKKTAEDPLGDLLVDRAALESTPKLFEKNTNLVRAYPNMTLKEARRSNKGVTDAFIDHVKSNLLWLHDQYAPEVRGRAKLWYVGANKIANDWAKEFDLPVASVSGVLASLSPQKDWFKNVSLARRVLDTYHGAASHQPATPEMMAKLEEVFPAAEYPTAHETVAGKALHDLDTPAKKAMWIRLYDEAHNDRSHRIVSPEGAFGDVRTKKDGTPTGTGWGSIPEIAKAVGSLESNGDRSKLSKLMGEQHKVRNFFNNILSPNSSRGDVTIDTHAIAAGLLRPLSGSSIEVKHNFGDGSGGSNATGVQGLYPLYAEAYRQAAKERGILPREMQSITWEAVRGLFPDTIKKKGNKTVAAIDATWHKYRNGELGLDDARSAIHDLAGGIKNPDWFRPSVGVATPDADPAHAGELDQDGAYGQAPGGLGSGPRDGLAGGSSETAAPALTDYLVDRVQRARGGRIRSIGAMATRWSPRPALMPDIDRDPVSDALAAVRRRF
jgi:hypothetical protein